uniref:Uncharacterized protein n=1 Tax=Solanum tuberosum TaxID=4113 RepID=M1BH43_SOLTU
MKFTNELGINFGHKFTPVVHATMLLKAGLNYRDVTFKVSAVYIEHLGLENTY